MVLVEAVPSRVRVEARSQHVEQRAEEGRGASDSKLQ